jgi:hypothetical protein
MREYTIETPAREITVQLSDEDASQRGLKPTEGKARTMPNKAETPEKRTPAQKRAEVADKSFEGAKKKP